MNIKKLLCGVLFAAAVASSAHAKDTLTVANIADIRTLDPLRGSDNVSANVHLQMFDNLVYINADGRIEPMLAERWERPTPTEWVFYIRKGVKFHTGEECTAEDVKFTLDRALSPVGVAAHALIKGIQSVDIVDSHTVKITMKAPETPFLYALGESWGGIVSKKAVESGLHEKTPIGTGPFKFVSWSKGDRVVMERFDDYYGQKPSFKNLIIRAIPETSSRTIELESGGIDVAYNIHHTDLKRIAESPRLKLLRRPSFRSEYIGLNCEKAPLNDVRVRKAIALAINTAAMQRVVWRGIGYAPNGPLPKGFPYCDETIPAHEVNIEKAKALLKEAGIKDGLTLEIWTNESKERVDAATIIQSMMAEIGITLNIKVMEYGTFLDGCRQGKHDLFVSGWGNRLPDPEYTFGRTFHSKGIGGNNYSFYKNAAFDAAMDEGLRLPDGPERAEAYKKVQQYLLDEVPALWWSVNETIFGVNKNIESFDINTRGMPRLWLTTFAK